jgi:hypothetical protein
MREVRMVEYPMSKIHPALKHGGYAATGLLPGEDRIAFEKLHHTLITELAPNGALEDDIVATMARLIWRKQNLGTFRIAELARNRCAELIPDPFADFEREEETRAAHEQAREELGDAYALVEVGETATVERLLRDLDVEERLEARIEKCLKRLLVLRGLKSISTAYPSPSPARIAGPSAEAA